MKKSLMNAYKQHGEKIQDNFRQRMELYDLIERDDIARQAEVALVHKDILRFFRYHAWTHEPRPAMLSAYGFKSPTLPFLLYPYQEDLILSIQDHIIRGQDALIEKSRDMGVSWMIITVILHFWLQPVAGNDFLLGSRKFEYVDKKGAQDTLFEKFRYNLYRLQAPLLPKGFTKENDNVGFIANPQTGSYVRGESNNANFATSGRYKAILADEFSKWEETDDQAWTSMGDSSPCRLPVSTPWGLGRKFAQLRFSGAIKVYTLHWSLHPIKSAGLYQDDKGRNRSTWYDAECERRSDDLEASIGQELDIDYLSSGTPYFDNTFISKKYQDLLSISPARYEFEGTGEKIKLFPSEHGRVYIVKHPEPPANVKDYRYILAADVAEGLEKGDYSVFYIYDRVTRKDVAWFRGHIDTDVFADLIEHFAVKYLNAFVAVENNNHGHAVIQKLKAKYFRLMYERSFTEFVDLSTLRLGWSTNQVTRPIMCSDLREAVKQNVDGILDKDFCQEAMTFIYNKNGKPEAEQGNFDDRVMAQAIKFQLHKWLPAPIIDNRQRWDDHGYDDHGDLKPVKQPEGKGARYV